MIFNDQVNAVAGKTNLISMASLELHATTLPVPLSQPQEHPNGDSRH
jgi:hypothetical protein